MAQTSRPDIGVTKLNKGREVMSHYNHSIIVSVKQDILLQLSIQS